MKIIIKYFSVTKLLLVLSIILFTTACGNEDECGYSKDCTELEKNFGDPCDSNGDEVLDGTVNEFCECITKNQKNEENK